MRNFYYKQSYHDYPTYSELIDYAYGSSASTHIPSRYIAAEAAKTPLTIRITISHLIKAVSGTTNCQM